MLKKIFIAVPAFVLLLAATFIKPEEKIKITQDIPANAKAGEEFTVTLTIHKSTITGLGRLQQDLPVGFTAENIDSHGAEFIFQDRSIKFNWLKLPEEDDFTVSYKIKTASNLRGLQIINGVFAYTDAGKTQRHTLTPVEITFESPENLSATTPAVSRKIICVSKETGEYRVELIIQPNNVNESAQFTDEIPYEYSVQVIEAHDALFSFENHSAVFKWDKFPTDSAFLISYTVHSGKSGPTPVITGILVYGDDENSAADQQQEMKETTESEDFKNASYLPATETNYSDQSAPMADIKTAIADKSVLPKAESGITFKVQISATAKSSVKNSQWFNSKYKVNSTVELIYQEGWKKYLIGSFQGYDDASAFKKQTQELISDAFVVAYENGVRIPVSEAVRNKSFNQ